MIDGSALSRETCKAVLTFIFGSYWLCCLVKTLQTGNGVVFLQLMYWLKKVILSMMHEKLKPVKTLKSVLSHFSYAVISISRSAHYSYSHFSYIWILQKLKFLTKSV